MKTRKRRRHYQHINNADFMSCQGGFPEYLKPEQTWQLFRKQCKLQSISVRRKGLREKLDRLIVLTPGDFAVIARSNRYDQITDAWQMIERLEQECSLKDSGHASIGFM